MPQPGAKRDARMDYGSPFVPITGKIIHFMTVIGKKCNFRHEFENLKKLALFILLDYFILIGTIFLFIIWDQRSIPVHTEYVYLMS